MNNNKFRIPRSVMAYTMILATIAMLLLRIEVPQAFFALLTMVITFYFKAKSDEMNKG